MKDDPKQEAQDIQDIKKQKEEQKQKREPLENWEFGKGVTGSKDGKKDVRG